MSSRVRTTRGQDSAEPPETKVSDIDFRLGSRVQIERRDRGWSLSDLSERSGVSRSQISKIERGVSSPTATVIGQLAAAFGLTISTLMGRAELAPVGRLTRFAELSTWTDPASGYIRRLVAPIAGTSLPFEIIHVELPVGGEVAYPAESYGYIDQVIMVLDGDLTFVEAETIHHLGEGDSLQLGTPVARTFLNNGGKVCRYINIVALR